MSDLFAEVDEVMRRERLEKFFKENGRTLIGFVVATVIATGLISGYRNWDASVRAKDTAELTALLDDASFPENIKAEKLDMRPGLKTIGLLSAAGAYVAEGKPDEALKLYQQASEDGSAPNDLRQLATLMTVRLLSAQEGNKQDLTAMLEGIAKDNSSPWRYHAQIEAAVLAVHEKQDYAAARQYLAKLLETKDLPDTLFAKAQALDHLYGLKQQEQKNPTEKTPGKAS
jgi:pentatricopeptide repeat protein